MLETISAFLENTQQSVDFDARANELLERAFRDNADDRMLSTLFSFSFFEKTLMTDMITT